MMISLTPIWYILNKKGTDRLAYANVRDDILNKNILKNKKVIQVVEVIMWPQATRSGQA